MRATLIAAMPFSIAVPEQTPFNLYPYEDSGYTVIAYPPIRTDKLRVDDVPETIKINGAAAFMADGIRIDFIAPTFNRDRDSGRFDPPQEVLMRAVESLVLRIRHVCHSPKLRMPEQLPWKLSYTNDDGSELEEDPRRFRAVGALQFVFQITGVTAQTWDAVHSLPYDWQPPPWEVLLLDARAALPHLGTAIVLAASSLEVLIGHVLDVVVARSAVTPGLWRWINDRSDNHLKQPSVEEQFSVLLKEFTGHSLKDESQLWQSFMNLKTARNRFVHTGIASIGSKPISLDDAEILIAKAGAIVEWIRERVPEGIGWTKLDVKLQFELEKVMLKCDAAGENVADLAGHVSTEREFPSN